MKRCVLSVLVLTVAALAAAQDGAASLPRATADRPDDFQGLQVHMIYAL